MTLSAVFISLFFPIQNILEFQIYDNDPYMRDDHIATVLFDIDNLTPEKKEKKCLILNDTVSAMW